MTNYFCYILELPKFIKKPFFVFLNRLNLKLNGVKYGQNCNLCNRLHLLVHPGGKVSIGKNFFFTSGDNFNQLSRNIRGSIYVDRLALLTIGDNVGISASCIWASESITIGSNVKIGADCLILDTDAHSLDYLQRRENDVRKNLPIKIGDDVLIGTRSIILKGVTIGSRSVIGAGSVVSHSIPDDCIAAGNPCKVIRYVNVKQTTINE